MCACGSKKVKNVGSANYEKRDQVHGLKEMDDGVKDEPLRTDLTWSDWSKDNANAVFVISSTMEYSQLDYLITCNSAAQMWSKLSAIHK